MTRLVAAVMLAMFAWTPTAAAAPKKASATTKPVAGSGSNVGEAKRLYSIGEQAMGKGRAAEAVTLWRQAVLLLPATADYDALRHKLVLRLGYGMLAASVETGDRNYAIDAATMLDRYASRHEELFGDGKEAEAQRGEVYELLYEAESKLETMPSGPPPEEAGVPSRIDQGAPEIGERKIAVPSKRKLEQPRVEDPAIRSKLKSYVTNVETGLVMTAPTIDPITPARGLVRIAGNARAVNGDGFDGLAVDRLARDAFVSVRPALRSCFEQAFARAPTDFVATEVELVVETNGTISKAKLVGAPVVDVAGSRCVVARLSDAQADAKPAERVTLRLPLLFFWESARYFDEASGHDLRNMNDLFGVRREGNFGGWSPMPAIDRGVGMPRRYPNRSYR